MLFDLNEEISKHFLENNNNTPKFPKKKWIGNRDSGFISQRQKELQHYFNMVVTYMDIEQCKPLKNFLFSRKGLVNPNPVQNNPQKNQPNVANTPDRGQNHQQAGAQNNTPSNNNANSNNYANNNQNGPADARNP
jgi:hypothetical protein